ncbi:hypothetical protein QJS10_CPB20g00739 [Acorus calamus]|uniref:Rab-GAP TBC domain-containing protein n=1 Tax=Acorus calamus TaxID=4465 RepID=A0AAV9CAK7_ACOCL|nr:hypothetical protein QJS10_CPB20g00739 [Acorus calamus]
MKAKNLPLITFEHKRDAYGFAEEEEERSDKWKDFLERQAESAELPIDGLSLEEDSSVVSGLETVISEQDDLESKTESKKSRNHKIQIWAQIRPSLAAIESMMSLRINKKRQNPKAERDARNGDHLAPIEEGKPTRGSVEEDSEEEFYDVERSDLAQDAASSDGSPRRVDHSSQLVSPELFFPWKEELECLVRGGVPMALRGELWQAFVGVRARRVENYYQDLLAAKDHDDKKELDDLPRTFPGHPALDEDGRNALRRLLTAYARHNPSVGYCQAMNFFAGLLLLLMPEENAFWTLMAIIDDYFDGYYSEEMIESQVDQLVFEELVRQRFPKLVNHLDYLGVQVAWVTGPWFLSIFVNMLPWESVLRVWDVLLFDGNRVMLFRSALAVMELYGPALVTTKDAGDAVTLLQSLAGSTFDSSQLVLTACMGYQAVNEAKLQELRNKHRPSVIAAMEERSRGARAWKDSQGLASKLYSFKHDPQSILVDTNPTEGLGDVHANGEQHVSRTNNIDEFLNNMNGDGDADSVPDLKEQVVWLKVELCKLLEEKRSSILRLQKIDLQGEVSDSVPMSKRQFSVRVVTLDCKEIIAEELETALMEMVKQDNRRQLSARVEQLEHEVAELRQALADKQEQEHAMLQVLMRVEQEQKVTEDARLFAEQDAAAQKYAAHVLQEKYEEAMSTLAQMEKRAVMAETMLEATLQYQSGQPPQGKTSNTEEPSDSKPNNDVVQAPSDLEKEMND